MSEMTERQRKRLERRRMIRALYGDLTLWGIFERIISSLSGKIVLVADFRGLGDKAQVSRTLRDLSEEGRIFPFMKQVYVKGREEPSGVWRPVSTDARELAREAYGRLGYMGEAQIVGNQVLICENGGKIRLRRRTLLFDPEASVVMPETRPRYRHMARKPKRFA